MSWITRARVTWRLGYTFTFSKHTSNVVSNICSWLHLSACAESMWLPLCVCVCLCVCISETMISQGQQKPRRGTSETEWKGEEIKVKEGERECDIKHAVTRHNTQTHVPQVHVHKQQVTKHVGTPLQTTQHFMFYAIHALVLSLYTTALHIICCQWLFVPTLQCPQLQLHWQCTIMVSITENIIKGSCWTHVECMLITWLCCFVQWNQNSKCWPCSCLHIQIPSTCDIIINLTGTFVHTVHTPTHTHTHTHTHMLVNTKALKCWCLSGAGPNCMELSKLDALPCKHGCSYMYSKQGLS